MPTLRSPRYNINIVSGTIAASGMYYRDLTKIPICAEEIPYNNIIIRNFSSQRYKIEYGDSIVIIGASEVFIDDKAYGTKDLKITNLDNVNAQDDLIYITLSRDISAEQAIVASITDENLHRVANGEI